MIRLTRIWKLYLFYTIVLIAGVTLAGFVVEKQISVKLKEHLIKDGLTYAKVIQKALPDTDDSSVLDAFCRTYQSMAGIRLTLIRKDGRVIGESESRSTEVENHLNRPEVQEAIHGKAGVSIRESGSLKMEMLYVGLPADEKGRIVRVCIPMTKMKTFQNELMALFSIALYLMPVLVMVAAFLFAKYRISDRNSSS